MNFDYPGYELKFIQKSGCRDGSDHLYTYIYKFYSPVTHYFYIIRADYHKENVFAVKFYCKKDRKSDYKYAKIVNKGDLGNILMSCLKVIPLLLVIEANASFAFTGSPTVDLHSKTVEPMDNNQRFRIYKELVRLKIGKETFRHSAFDKASSYLLINNANKDIDAAQTKIIEMFVHTYNTLSFD